MKTIGILNVSSPLSKPIDKTMIEDFFKAKNFRVVWGKHTFDENRFLAGTDKHRVQDLHDFFKSPKIDAIMTLRGGYGSPRLLPLVDFDLIKKHKKPFFGFSDVTALQLAMWAKADLVSYSGFMPFVDIKKNKVDPLVEQGLDAALNDTPQEIPLTPIRTGSVFGRLLGGNLTMMASMLGTPFAPDWTDAVLVIEEVDEEPYKIDRLLTHLSNAGVFKGAKAVLWGTFKDCISKDPKDGTIEDVIAEWTAKLKLSHYRMPYGHDASRCVWPMGKEVEVDKNKLFIP